MELDRYNMDPESVVLGDRLRARNTSITDRVRVGDKSATPTEVAADPARFYPQWFNPNHERLLPLSVSRERYERWRRELRELHGGLELVWHPLREVWQVYFPNPKIGHLPSTAHTRGWERIVMIEPGNQDSLVTRIKAKLYFMKPEVFGRAKPHADRILYERELAERRFEAKLDEGARENAREIYWKGLPKNISHGAKVAEMYE